MSAMVVCTSLTHKSFQICELKLEKPWSRALLKWKQKYSQCRSLRQKLTDNKKVQQCTRSATLAIGSVESSGCLAGVGALTTGAVCCIGGWGMGTACAGNAIVAGCIICIKHMKNKQSSFITEPIFIATSKVPALWAEPLNVDVFPFARWRHVCRHVSR